MGKKQLNIHRVMPFWGAGDKNENIKNLATLAELHYAIYLLFDILIPKSRIMQTARGMFTRINICQ